MGIRRRQKQGTQPRLTQLSSLATQFDLDHRIRIECRISHDLDLILELSFGNTGEGDGTSLPVSAQPSFSILNSST